MVKNIQEMISDFNKGIRPPYSYKEGNYIIYRRCSDHELVKKVKVKTNVPKTQICSRFA